MSDRIAVMQGGVVEQLAGPRELYERPATAFVAGFIGTSNLLTLRVDSRREGLVRMNLGEAGSIAAADPGGDAAALQITVRPEKIKLEAVSGDSCRVDGTIAEVVYLGSTTQMIVELPTGERLAVHRLNDDAAEHDPAHGDRVTLHWAAEHSFVIGGQAAAATPERAAIG